MTDTDRLLLAKTEDLVRLCNKYAAARFSDFLDGGESALIAEEFCFPYDCNYLFFGGFEECERKLLGVFPEWEESDKMKFPISVLRMEGGFGRKLTHRDYLGTLMSLGIERSKIGDIITEDSGAYVFVCTEVAEYIKNNISKIGNQGVKVTYAELSEFENFERKFQKIETVCASLRLDAVAASAAGLSRREASDLVTGGKIKLNFKEVTDGSKNIKIGDMVSIRGCGRYILTEIGNETRKGKIHIVLNKYA